MSCPICGSREVSTLSNISVYNFCSNCQTAWLKKKPKTTYSEDYYEPKSNIANKLFTPITLFLYWLRGVYVGIDIKGTWIDVGAGDGAYLITVNAKKKIGVEVSKYGISQMKKANIEVISPNKFLSGRYNASVISFWHVLEHLENPLAYLISSRKNLNKKGKIVIGVPNIDSFEFRVFGKDWFHLFPQFHLWHFSPTSLKILLTKSGFDNIRLDYFAPEHHFASTLQSFINKTASSRNILLEIFRRQVEPGTKKTKFVDILWCIFWLIVGFPFVFSFWLVSSILHKSGAIVIAAESHK